jgi:lanthionine synthetase-like protein
MVELIQRELHVSRGDARWNEAEARAAIREIADDALTHFDPETLWPSHPLDGVPHGLAGLYMGASGVILALEHLKRAGAIDYARDFAPVLPRLMDQDDFGLKDTTFGAYGSLLMRDLGPLLLAMRLAPSADIADRVYARIEDNNALPPLELMWGTAGSMLACVFMDAITRDARVEALYRIQAARLIADLEDRGAYRIWLQDIYGQRHRFVGLVHGFAGNMLALLKRWRWLTPEQQRTVEEISVTTLAATARRSKEGANWPSDSDQPDAPMLCQVCHGAPGIVLAFAEAPFRDPQFETLLEEAGNLIWSAGPLKKGSNLCHGTGGNGYAFLKLYERTGDPVWLERARAFAMTAIGQVRAAREQYGRGRYSLWTGDPGLAVYLWDCITGEPRFPSIDAF